MKSAIYCRQFRLEPLEFRRLLTAAGWHHLTASAIEDVLEARAEPENGRLNVEQQTYSQGHGDSCCCEICQGIVGYAESDDTAAGWDTGTPVDITHEVTIQPVIVSNTDGSNSAAYFGNSLQQAIIEDLIDMVWAQAGIDIEWLQPNTWNNTYANVGNGSTNQSRPSSDLNWITTQGDTALVGSSDPLVLDMYFVEIAAGFPELNDNFANGLAFLGGNGSTLHVGDNLLSFASGREVIARVVAHEIGHNLGLAHVSDPPNLMDDGERLSQSQITTALNSQFSVPLPENSAPVVTSPIQDRSVLLGSENTVIDLATVFDDPDRDLLVFEASSSNPNVVSASVSNEQLVLSYPATTAGSSTITVTASDPGGKFVNDVFEVTLDSANSATDWGMVNVQQVVDVSIVGASWYRLTTSQAGILTVAADFNSTEGDITFELYDADLNRIGQSSGVAGSQRADVAADAQEVFYINVAGSNPDVDFSLINAVSTSGNVVQAYGNSGNTRIGFRPGATHEISVNEISYNFDGQLFNAFTLIAEGSQDWIAIAGLPSTDNATFRPGSLGMYGAGYGVNAFAERIEVVGMGGSDIANFYDSENDDTFEAEAGNALLQYQGGATAAAIDFDTVYATSSAGGTDTAVLRDSQQKDYFYAQPGYSYMKPESDDYFLQAAGFQMITGESVAGGGDVATLQDSSFDDELLARPGDVRLAALNDFFSNQAIGFTNVIANSVSGGQDRADFFDSEANDEFVSLAESAFMHGIAGEYFHVANGFATNRAFADAGGLDTAVFFDGAGDDTFVAQPDFAYMTGSDVDNQASRFESYLGISENGGTDTAVLFDSEFDDTLTAGPGSVQIQSSGSSYSATANGFQSTHSLASTGNDSAELFAGPQPDQFVARPKQSFMAYHANEFVNYVNEFDTVRAYASENGQDTAIMFDSAGNDIFDAKPDIVSMRDDGNTYENIALNFGTVYGNSELGGVDQAILYDSPETDSFIGTPTVSNMRDAQGTFSNFATGFAQVQAIANSGGSDTAVLVDSQGNDTLQVGGNSAVLTGPDFENTTSGFHAVTALSENGGEDVLDESAVDFLFNANGPWL